jgi:hypothetical protein
MAHSLIHRLPALLVASAAAATISAAPALASEGPAGPAPPGPPPLPAALSPVNFAPMPATPVRKRARPAIRRAKLVSRKVRRGRHARLRLTLSAPGKVRITLERSGRGRRVRSASMTVAAGATKLSVRLPARSHGRALAAGRYRVTITAIDAEGSRSRPVHRLLVIRRKAR